MVSDMAFFDATLERLSQLSVQRAFSADTRMPNIQKPLVPLEERVDFYSLAFKTLKAPVRKFTLHVSSVRTVAQVKRHLSRVSNIPVTAMRLVLNGKGLVDTKLIGDYSIQPDDVIQIISKPAGTASASETAQEPAVADVPEINPLSSTLAQAEPRPAISAAGRVAEVAVAEDVTDASSDADACVVLSKSTKDQLQQKNGTFRNNLRELLHTQFGGSQADAVDHTLDSYFASL
ncbi:hypothetical protein LPJ61_003870 [Coemansia biformis]|uniref:Ubiquitin-like domain-containing protein n=1 Tax=Coemansia biformis TaxID=1286918 RepID=A0A9W7Y9Q9_9FUNG|nr:hypothetical protein LPJ61_003870 [Coemansia biformis]